MKLNPQICLALAILTILLAAPTHAWADAVSDWNGIAFTSDAIVLQ